MLKPDDFIKAIELTQLVSVDLILTDENYNVLVGKRVNEPAKGVWFVPGSRLFKNETIGEGIKRVSREEVGVEITKEDTTFMGVYDHIYNSNFLNRTNNNGKVINTHYVCMGFSSEIDPNLVNKDIFLKQHSELRWMPIEEILNREDVHQNTKNYFIDGVGFQ